MKKLILFLIAAPLMALPPVEVMSHKEKVKAHNEWINKGENYSSRWAGWTGSMRPYLIGYETLLIEKRKWNTPIHKGDFVIFLREDGVMPCHEVIEINSGKVLIKGLNNEQADGYYPFGKVKWIIRRVIRVK